MRLGCSRCGKVLSTEVPEGTIVRAFIECPECIGKEYSWEKEFEEKLYFKIDGNILTKDGKNLRYLLAKVLDGMSELKMKTKIKVRKGCIQIERIK